MKDWTGNDKTAFTTLGASNHSDFEREVNDYYATEPKAIKLLLELETFDKNIWECACGAGHLSNELESYGYNVKSTDLINRGYGESGVDFLQHTELWDGDIITNPPYKYATEFIEKSLGLIPEGKKVAMFLRLQFLEGKRRKLMYKENPPKTIYVSSSRLACAMNGDFENMKGNAICYAWFVWEKGFKGTTELKWFN